MPLGAAVA
uniref:Uncharacterized protein n=1 Tax=Arundo donax TaxID=35708 RepID=A0A0A8ZM63_ARUDO